MATPTEPTKPTERRYFIGVDPGVQWSALAILDVREKRVHFAAVRASFGLRAADITAAVQKVGISGQEDALAVVEGQQVYTGPSGGKVDKQDIVHLAQEAGRVAGMIEGAGVEVLMPKPSEWKGTVPKDIHNARTLKRMAQEGIELDWAGIPPSDRNHYVDALALAWWLHLKKNPGLK